MPALHTWWSPVNICVTPISLQINTFCCRGTACCARLPVPCTWIRNAPLSEVIHTKHFTSARHLFENQTDRCNAPRKVHRTKIVMGMDRFFGHAVRDYTNRKPYQIQCRITTQQSVLIPIRTTTLRPKIPHSASPSIVNEIQLLHSGWQIYVSLYYVVKLQSASSGSIAPRGRSLSQTTCHSDRARSATRNLYID